MQFRRVICGGFAALMAIGATTAAAPQANTSAALSRLESGLYEIKVVSSTGPARQFCLADAAMLIQLQHPGAACSRMVMADGPDGTTVNYSCAGGGHGRTVVTITTPRSFDLQTQGISSGAPFDLDYQGRRIGACTAHSAPGR